MSDLKKNEGSPKFWHSYLVKAAEMAYKAVRNFIGTKEGAEAAQKGVIGAGGDLTLQIDKMAEDAIIRVLAEIPAEFYLVTEEKGFIKFKYGKYAVVPKPDFENHGEYADSHLIVVDPVDGSHNASTGFPMACVSIAHAKGDHLSDVDCGVILNIYTGDLYEAISNQGARMNGMQIQVNKRSRMAYCLFGISLSLGESLVEFAQRYSFIFDKSLKIRSFGSNAMGFALVASGSLNCFLDLQKKSRPFDLAAGYCILKEAGGTIWDLKGNPLDAHLDVETRIAFICSNAGLKSKFEELMPQFIEAWKTQPQFKAPEEHLH